MTVRNTPHRWGVIAQLLHWLIALLVVVQVTLAMMADDLPVGMKKLTLLARHKSVGITILVLAAFRLGWRWANPTPNLPATLKPYEVSLARASHALLYVLLFAVPLTGWTMSSARGFPVSWFGFFTLPDLVPKSKPLYDALVTTHTALAWTLVALAALHAGAALKHHFIHKNDVLRRMLPLSGTTEGSER
jgi:cytochrome b561